MSRGWFTQTEARTTVTHMHGTFTMKFLARTSSTGPDDAYPLVDISTRTESAKKMGE